MKWSFYLRVFKVNLDQDNYSAVLQCSLSLPPPHQLFLHLPPLLPSLPSFPLTAFLVPCDAAFRLHVHHFSCFRTLVTSLSLSFLPSSGLPSFPQPPLLNPFFFVSFLLSYSSSLCLFQDPSCEPLSWLFFHMVNISAGPKEEHQHDQRVCPQHRFIFSETVKWIQGSQVSSHHKTPRLPLRSKKTQSPPLAALSFLPFFLCAQCKLISCGSASL